MSLSNFNGILLSDLSAFDGISSISAINGIAATLGTDVTAPTLTSATVASNGTTLTLVFSEAVSQGAGYNDADLDLDASTTGSDLGLTYVSGDGTNTWVYTIGSTIQGGETVDLDFNGDADSIEDGAGNDLAAIVSRAVTNNSSQGAGDITTGLVGWWKMDEGTGTSSADDSVNTNTCNFTGSPSWTTGHIGANCIVLDGSTQYGDCGTDSSLNPAAVTYAAWIYPTDLTNAYSAILMRTDGAGADFVNFYVKSNGKLAAYIRCSTGDVSADGTGSATLSTNTWTHVALTYSSTAGLTIYVNGVSDATAAANGNIRSVSANFMIGEDVVTSGRRFAGRVDEVRVFSRALVQDDITTLYNYTG